MRGLSQETKALILEASAVLLEAHPQTLRQIHYQIFSRARVNYKNDEASYKRLSRTLTKARRAYRQWELDGKVGRPPEYSIVSYWIVDEMRRPERVNFWTDATEYIDTVREAYRRDSWQDQPYHVELWGEKATVLQSMRPITEKYGITLRVCRGFGSAGMEDQIGRVFENVDKNIVVLYVGDHDASGDLIGEDMHRRVEDASGIHFDMERLAVNAEDITRFNLPPQQIKVTDKRAARFEAKYGAGAATVELEALPVAELRRRVEDRIKSLIAPALWARQLEIQQVEIASIQRFADTIKNLPQLDA
jgi:hypothetical protein